MKTIKKEFITGLNGKIQELTNTLTEKGYISLEEIVAGCCDSDFIKKIETDILHVEESEVECPIIKLEINEKTILNIVGKPFRKNQFNFIYEKTMLGEYMEDYYIEFSSAGEVRVESMMPYNENIYVDFVNKLNLFNNFEYQYKDKEGFSLEENKLFLEFIYPEGLIKSRSFEKLTYNGEEYVCLIDSKTTLDKLPDLISNNELSPIAKEFLLNETIEKLQDVINSAILMEGFNILKFSGIELSTTTLKISELIILKFDAKFQDEFFDLNIIFEYDFERGIYYKAMALGENFTHFEYDDVDDELYLGDFLNEFLEERESLEEFTEHFYRINLKNDQLLFAFKKLFLDWYEEQKTLNTNSSTSNNFKMIQSNVLPYFAIKDEGVYKILSIKE